MPHASFEFVMVLLSRLERISADSRWAHQASGIRGALFGLLTQFENRNPIDFAVLDRLVDQGYDILKKSLDD
jgi:hypothetical protein